MYEIERRINMKNNKLILTGIFAALLVGVVLVSASSYYSVREIHQEMIASDDFSQMNIAMMNGDFNAAEEYHKNLDFECPMHDLVTSGDVSLDDFATMHEWMMTGEFPDEKPEGLSDAAWELHMNHHSEIYG